MPLPRRALRTCAIVAVHCLVLLLSVSSAAAQGEASTGGPVAFAGADGNIWLAGPDGSDQRLAMQLDMELGDSRLAVSPDGTMVAQAVPGGPIWIWHLSDGTFVEIPWSAYCVAPRFSSDSQRLIYVCGPGVGPDPAGLVLSNAVDGSDLRVEVPMPEGAPAGIADARLSDGMMLVTEWRDTDEGQGSLPHTVLYDAQLNEVAAFEGTEVQEWGRQALFDMQFSPDGEAIVARVCESGCIYNQETVERDFLIGFDGIIIERITPQWLIDAGGSRMSVPLDLTAGVAAQPAPAADASNVAGDLIAYIGVDGNVWLVNSDGSNPQQITDDANIPGYGSYANPSWSHDGSMLAFEGPSPGSVSAIFVWTVGEPGRVEIESTEHCANPVFSGDNQRVLYQCHQSQSGPPVSPLDPRNGEIVSSAIDGTDQRIELESSPDTIPLMFGGIDVRPSDGAVMIWSFDPNGIPRETSVRLYDAAFNEVSSVMLPIGTNVDPAAVGPIDLTFSPDGERLVALVCTSSCIEHGTTEAFAGVVADFDGNILERWQPDAPLDPSTLYYLRSIDMASDGTRMVASYVDVRGTIGTFDATGTWSPIAEGHSAAWQSSVSVDATADVVESQQIASAPPEPDEPGWIAYVNNGVWVMRPDGSERIQLMEAPPGGMWSEAGQLAWSHDGAMLAWNGPTDPGELFDAVRGIWVYRDNQAFLLPNTAGCAYPAFSADNQRVYYTCAAANLEDPTEEQLASDPRMGFLSSSAIDGSDQRIEISYTSEPPAGTWTDVNGVLLQGESVDVNPTDGSLLVSYTGEVDGNYGGVMLLDANLAPVVTVPNQDFGDAVQWVYEEFLPGGEVVVVRQCLNGCSNGSWAEVTDLQGNQLSRPILVDAVGYTSFDLSPDGMHAIAWTGMDGTVMLSQTGLTGTYESMEQKLEWQPVPVKIGAPVGPPVVLDATEATEEEPAPVEEPTATPEETGGAAPETTPTETASTTSQVSDGRIAYVSGLSVYTINPDGTDIQQIAPELPFEESYLAPAWSHDGSMLAFAGPSLFSEQLQPYQGIWVWRDGELVQFENTIFCFDPEFSADNQRVYYHCWPVGFEDVTPTELATVPHLAILVSSAIDGTDQRVEIAHTDAAPGGGDFLDSMGNRMGTSEVDVNPADGSILVTMTDVDRRVVFHYDAELNPIARYDQLDAEQGELDGVEGVIQRAPLPYFLPDGSIGFVDTCVELCANGLAHMVVDLDGNPLDYPLIASWTGNTMALAPTGDAIALQRADSSPSMIEIVDQDGNVVPLVEGHSPAWQPVPVETPDAAEAGDSDAGEASSTETEVAAVPAELETGPGWIAYVVDGGIRLVRPDLSEVVTVFEIEFGSNLNPVWSPDGSMLAWNGPTWSDPALLPYRGIWVLANGQVTQLPGTELCSLPAFSADNSRIYYVCAGPEHQEQPVEAIIPEDLIGVPATGVYIPSNTWLGSISSSAIDGSDQRIELAYDGSGDPAWGGLAGPMMVYTFEVRPTDGALMVAYRDPVAPPTVAGTLVLDTNLSLISNTPLAEGDIFPLMLPDGTIVTPRPCENLCPNGMPVTLTTLDGAEVDSPVAAQLAGPAWTFDLSPDASQGVAWTYHDGVWIQGADGNRIVVDPSGMYPAWQPVPVEIALPQ